MSNILLYYMKKICHVAVCTGISSFIILLTACGPTVNKPPQQQVVTINKSFQSQLSPIPTVPAYQCGAWSSNNVPDANDTITIYARLTKDVTAVSGATAKAVAHFKDFDQPLDQQPTSDNGGYVSFSLPLQGHQPRQVPATVSVSFTVEGNTINCTDAFFTPQ